MKLRLNANSIRFRLEADEYDLLQRDNKFEQIIPTGDGLHLQCDIQCEEFSYHTTYNRLHLATKAIPQGMFFTLTVSPQALLYLSPENPNKEGVKDFKTLPDGAILTIRLEVDIRSIRN